MDDVCPWVIVGAVAQVFRCTRCKKELHFPPEGMTINSFCEIGGAFCELHKNCKDKEMK